MSKKAIVDFIPAQSVAWTPLSLANLVVYLDANSGVGTSGGHVISWLDQSTNAYSFTGGGVEVTLVSNFNSSHNGIKWTVSVGQSLANSAVTFSSTHLSYFILFSDTANSQSACSPCGMLSNGAANDFNSPSWLTYMAANTNINLYSSGYQGNGGAAISISNNTVYSFGTILDGTHGTSYLNFSAQGAQTAFSSSIGSSPNKVQLGTRMNGTPGSPFEGTIGYVIITSGAMSGTDITNLKTWTNANWGTSF